MDHQGEVLLAQLGRPPDQVVERSAPPGCGATNKMSPASCLSRRTEVAAQGDQHGREAAPVDEVAFHRAPLALRWRRWTRPKGGAAGALLHLGEEGQRVRHGTSEPMDRQVDGSGAPLPAQMVVEHEAVDADDRFGMPPACVVFGVAAVAEGAEDIFEGVASQPLRPRAAIPWVEMPHGYAGSGVPRSFGPPLPDCRRRRRSALRCFWRSGRPVRASLASRPVPAFPVIRRVGPRVARFEACSTFTIALRPTWALSRPGRPVAPECFSRSRYLLQPLRLLPAGATVAGRDSHPLGDGTFPRRSRVEDWRASFSPTSATRHSIRLI